ncbi:30518_t:CDS:2 [Racocetra persica]|uniref:30518_t:CDS:1 n=1 Tax=Racocetra persica TaxID=160502 RepID=A0ACA9KBY8_9GLOM|nr:30518_t:CDS:2 [Racocetra persica]
MLLMKLLKAYLDFYLITSTDFELKIVSNKESKTIKLILKTTKQVVMQSNSIIKKQESFETTVIRLVNNINSLIIKKQELLEAILTQLINDIKTLQSSYKDIRSNMKDQDQEWW